MVASGCGGGSSGNRLEGTLTKDGEPVAHVSVELERVADKSKRSTKTGDKGEFAFDRVEPGEHDLTAVVPYEGGIRCAASTSVSVKEGRSPAPVEFDLPDEAPEGYFFSERLVMTCG